MSIEIDTLGRGKDMVNVILFYPREPENPEQVTITLYDVRAANSITIEYDFKRDGWRILSDLLYPDIEDREQSDELKEIAFIEAWPKGEI